MIKNIFFTLIYCQILFVSCSNTETVIESPQYSEETNKAFSMIEQNGGYRSIHQTSNEKQKSPSPQIQKKKASEYSTNVSQDKLIEINQKLAFFCMKYRNDRRFQGNEELCHKHVQQTLLKCQKKKHVSNHSLMNCIHLYLNKGS